MFTLEYLSTNLTEQVSYIMNSHWYCTNCALLALWEHLTLNKMLNSRIYKICSKQPKNSTYLTSIMDYKLHLEELLHRNMCSGHVRRSYIRMKGKSASTSLESDIILLQYWYLQLGFCQIEEKIFMQDKKVIVGMDSGVW